MSQRGILDAAEHKASGVPTIFCCGPRRITYATLGLALRWQPTVVLAGVFLSFLRHELGQLAALLEVLELGLELQLLLVFALREVNSQAFSTAYRQVKEQHTIAHEP